MRLARLRHRMLLAMGLPACWGGAGSAPPVAPPVVAPAPVAKASQFDVDRCAKDTVVETMCGLARPGVARCGAHGDSIDSVETTNLSVSDPTVDVGDFHDFLFDRTATLDYHEALAAEGGSADEMCCYARCTPITVGVAQPQPAPAGWHPEDRCIPVPPQGTTKPAASNPECPIGVAFLGTLRPFSRADEESCCYTVPERDRRVIKGRAIRIDGEPAAAPVHASASWTSAPLLPVLPDDVALRRRLAAAWLDAARMEHASIAAFSQLSLRLLAHGAPPTLLADVHRAALDEIEHARLAFELASAYGGAPVGPDRFDALAVAAPAEGLAALAVETLVDGCINETIAALEAEHAAALAEDPVVAAVLARIAEDEARHAELAFAIVRWCVARQPATLGELRTALSGELAAPTPTRPGGLEAHGVLDDATLARLRADVLREVVAPCLAALSS